MHDGAIKVFCEEMVKHQEPTAADYFFKKISKTHLKDILKSTQTVRKIMYKYLFIVLLYFNLSLSQIPNIDNAASAWLFDEGTGETASNYIIGGPEGMIVGGANWVEGLYGNALEFDGMDDGVEIPSNPLLGAHALTVQAYIKPYSIPDYESSKIFNIGIDRDTPGKDRFMLDILPDGNKWILSNFMSIEGNVLDPEDELMISGPSHGCNKWYHVAMVFDSVSLNMVKVNHYVDHSLEHQWDYNLDTLKSGASYIGERYEAKGSGVRNYFHGVIDNVVLHNFALLPEEFMPKPEDVTDIRSHPFLIPSGLDLDQNYPNPFNPGTTIRYDIPSGKKIYITLCIYNIRGQLVKTLVEDYHTAGRYSINWDGTNYRGDRISSGIYWYRLTAGKNILSKRMVLLR